MMDRSAEPVARVPQLDLRIELGTSRLWAHEAEGLGPGSLVPLDTLAAQSVAIVAGGRLRARGEVLVRAAKLCVRITELI